MTLAATCGAPTLQRPRQRTAEDVDGQIDELVFRLYGLTANEIRIVEESAS